jgi:ATP-binding cassette subfamily B protein
LCITHDVGETQNFDRVLVIDHGHVIEDGSPSDLLAQPESMYRSLIEAEQAVCMGLWSGPRWRYLELQDGQVQDISRANGEGRPS